MSGLSVSDAVGIVTALSQAIVTLLQRQTSPEAVAKAIEDIVERAHAIDRDVDLAARGHVPQPDQATPLPTSATSSEEAPR